MIDLECILHRLAALIVDEQVARGGATQLSSSTAAPPPPRRLTIAQYAEARAVSISSVRRAIKAGALPIERLGRSVRILDGAAPAGEAEGRARRARHGLRVVADRGAK